MSSNPWGFSVSLPPVVVGVESWFSTTGDVSSVIFGGLADHLEARSWLLDRLRFTRSDSPEGQLERVSVTIARYDGQRFQLGSGIGRAPAEATGLRRYLLDD